jgi:sortase A
VEHPERDAQAGRQAWVWIERVAWAGGIATLGLWSLVMVSGPVGRQHELQRFAALQSPGSGAGESASGLVPDQRLWSPERVRAWIDSRARPAPPPLAVLRIARLGLKVPVLEGTDDWTLNRAIGHIEDTAAPGTDGNCGIAGHRDGFFRGLKDIESGDLLDLDTPGGVDHYKVERTWIVEPEDVSVLDPTPSAAVTLVTCYPFYFVGSAPHRFIVRAVRTGSEARPGQLRSTALLTPYRAFR